MRSPAVALAWEFWWRHRWGFAGVAALVAGFAAYCSAAFASAQFASVSSIWFVMGLCYAVGVFSYGFEAKLEAAESGFPTRFFVLPVRTRVLVGLPMVLGVVTTVLLWLAWDSLVLRPCGVRTPAWWAAMLAAAVAACQALVWVPFGLPWLRPAAMFALIFAMIRGPGLLSLIDDQFNDPENAKTALTLIAAAMLPLAFLAATAGVARARRGDGSVWALFARPPRVSAESRPEARPFASAVRAQVWYEWRMRGRGFVSAVVVVVGMLMLLGLLEDRSARADFGLLFLFIPPLIAAFWGGQMGSPGESIRSTALSTFAATRPLDNATLALAKFRAATRAAVVAWVFVLLAVMTWFALTDGFNRMSRTWDSAVEAYGRGTTVGYWVLFFGTLVLGTWRALVANQWVGLAGRTWMVPAHVFLMSMLALYALAEWAAWNYDPSRREQIARNFLRLAIALVVLKAAAAGWLLRVLGRRNGSRAAGWLLAGWAAAAVLLFAVLVWLVPPSLVPVYALALGAVLFLPLTRLVAAPLALGWNRHR
jgi:hypothetical protein